MTTRILLPAEMASRIHTALSNAGKREIGGILMGEQVEPGTFRIADLTIQTRGGTVATFIRKIGQALCALQQFFDRKQHDYERFNYLGEWHSHPLFEPIPSGPDHVSMHDLADCPETRATFVTLMIVRLSGQNELEATATIYLPGNCRAAADLVFEDSHV